jgi:hypothetical protein
MDRNLQTPITNLETAMKEFTQTTSFEIYGDKHIVEIRSGMLLEQYKNDQGNKELEEEIKFLDEDSILSSNFLIESTFQIPSQ